MNPRKKFIQSEIKELQKKQERDRWAGVVKEYEEWENGVLVENYELWRKK